MSWLKIGDERIKRCPMSVVDKDVLLFVQMIINSLAVNINCYGDEFLDYPSVLADAIVFVKLEFEKYKMEKQNVR